MTSVAMRLVSIATVMLATAVIATPVHAETCVNAMPAAARDVRGYTFEGEILSIRLRPVEEPGMPRASDVTIAISKVYANPTDRPLEEPLRQGQTIEIHSNACDGIRQRRLESQLQGLDQHPEPLQRINVEHGGLERGRIDASPARPTRLSLSRGLVYGGPASR